MAPKKRSKKSLAAAGSSDEDSSSHSQEVQRPTKKAGSDEDGAGGFDKTGSGNEVQSSDEIGEDGVLTNRQSPSKKFAAAAAAELPAKNVLKRKAAGSPPRMKKMAGKSAARAPKNATPPAVTRNAAAAQLARSPSPQNAATAAALGAANSPAPMKKAPPTGSADKTTNVNPLTEAAAPAPVEQERDGETSSGDEVESGVLTNRQPLPKGMVAAELPMKNVAYPEASLPKKRKATVSRPPKKRKTGKDAAELAGKIAASPLVNSNVPAAQLAKSLEKVATVAASGADKSPTSKTATVVAVAEAANSPRPKKSVARAVSVDERIDVAPSPKPAAAAGAEKDVLQPQEDEYDTENLLKEKSQTYWYLWQMMLALEQKHSFSFKQAFLKFDDARASILNTKIKDMCVEEMEVQETQKDIIKHVTRVLIKLIH